MSSAPKIPVTFTPHALRQAQRRGVSFQTLKLVLAHYDRSRKLGGAARALWVSRRRRKDLVVAGVLASEIDRTAGVRLVISLRDDAVLTVEHTTARRHWA